MKLKRLITTALSLCVLAPFASGDIVVLKNGDRATGKVVKKDGQTVTFNSDSFGAIKFDWNNIREITTDAPVTVVLPGEVTEKATLVTRGETVELRSGTSSKNIPIADVVTLRDAAEQTTYERLLRPGWADLWAGAATFNLAGTQGNAKTSTIAASVAAARVTRADKATIYFNAIRAAALVNDVQAATARAVRGGIGYSRNVSSRMFVNVFNDYEYDRFQSLDLRFVLGGGAGYTAWRAERGRLDLLAGLAYNRENFGPPAPQSSFSRNSMEAYFGDDFSYKLTGVTSLTQSFRIFPNLTRTGDYRMNFDLGADTRIARWLIWNLAVSDRLLSNPAPGRQKNDFLYTTGIGVTFAR